MGQGVIGWKKQRLEVGKMCRSHNWCVPSQPAAMRSSATWMYWPLRCFMHSIRGVIPAPSLSHAAQVSNGTNETTQRPSSMPETHTGEDN